MKLRPLVDFKLLQDRFIIVPVVINDSLMADFIVDTGIGINLVSLALCRQLNCAVSGTYTGRRMSGQLMSVPLSSLDSLSFGGERAAGVPVGVFDIDALIPGASIGGFLSLGFFRDKPVTFDYRRRTARLEGGRSLELLRDGGAVTAVEIEESGPCVSVKLPLELPGGRTIRAAVDTGSQALILDESFMRELGVSPEDPAVRAVKGKDETGREFTRYFSRLQSSVHLPGIPAMGKAGLEVMFQKIRHDGLAGNAFLREFVVTYDLPRGEMIFRKSGAEE